MNSLWILFKQIYQQLLYMQTVVVIVMDMFNIYTHLNKEYAFVRELINSSQRKACEKKLKVNSGHKLSCGFRMLYLVGVYL